MAILTRVFPEQLDEVWELVRHAIEQTTRTPTPEKTNNILKAIVIGSYRCWAVMEENVLYAVALTSVVSGFGFDRLLLHTFYIYKKLNGTQLVDLWEQLEKIAKAAKCEEVIFYTSNEKLCEFVERHGGLLEKFVSIPIGG